MNPRFYFNSTRKAAASIYGDGCSSIHVILELWVVLFSGSILAVQMDRNPSCAEYKKALQLINRNEEKLMASMTDAQKELFAGYTDSVREFRAIAECLLFQNSFRLGARMIVGNNESNL